VNLIKNISFLICISYSVNIAQTESRYSEITGRVRDFETNKPLAGANVVAMNTNYGAASNLKGKFEVKLPSGTYSIKFSMVGYEDLIIDNIVVAGNETTVIDTSLRQKAINLESVVITPKTEKYDATSLTAMLNRDMIMRSPGSAQDIFWTLQTLPGVSSGSDDSKLYVRGGSAAENLILFDGATISNPYHFEFMGGGLFSIFNSRLMDEVKFYSGGFPARYGDRLSSVLVINNKTASKENLGGEVTLSLTDLNGVIEYPVKALNGSGFLSLRRSYFDFVYKLIPDLKGNNETIPYFYDYYGKLDFNISDYGKLTFTGLSSYENLYGEYKYDHFNGVMNSDGYNQSFGTRLNLILSDNSLNEFNFYYSKSDKEAQYPQNSFENYKFIEYGLKNDLSLLYQSHEIHLGGWVIFKNDNVSVNLPGEINFYTLEDYKINSNGNYILYSLYGEYKIKLTDEISMNNGLRFDYIDKLKKGVLSPRLNIAYAWNEHMSLSFDYGWYYQSPMAYEAGANSSLKFKKAETVGIGIKHQITNELAVNLELYNKKLYDLVTNNNQTGSFLSEGYGFSRGVELYVQIKPDDNLFGWFSYSYSIAKRKEGIIRSEQYFSFDRTHLLSAVINFRFSEVWNISGKYRFGSGTPYTPVSASYFDQSSEKYFPILEIQNSARYPDYNRLDIRLTRQFNLGIQPLEIYLEVLNVINNRNVVHWIYNADYTSRSEMTVLPLIPVIGVNWKI